jgi:hypothetical protein
VEPLKTMFNSFEIVKLISWLRPILSKSETTKLLIHASGEYILQIRTPENDLDETTKKILDDAIKENGGRL